MPMIAFLCHFYGGMPEQWLQEPVRRFFAMYRTGLIIEAKQFSELTSIALVPQMKLSYFESLKTRYAKIADPKGRGQLPPPPPSPCLTPTEGGMAMLSVGRTLRRSLFGR